MQQKMSQLAATANENNNSTTNIIVERIENDVTRMRRTTNLLIWVGVMFCVCWLPLNILNTVRDSTRFVCMGACVLLTYRDSRSIKRTVVNLAGVFTRLFVSSLRPLVEGGLTNNDAVGHA